MQQEKSNIDTKRFFLLEKVSERNSQVDFDSTLDDLKSEDKGNFEIRVMHTAPTLDSEGHYVQKIAGLQVTNKGEVYGGEVQVPRTYLHFTEKEQEIEESARFQAFQKYIKKNNP